MSHDRPIPDAARSPFPAHPDPVEPGATPTAATTEKPSEDRTRRVIAGAAVGIGSAAIVAALLYANRKPAKVEPPKQGGQVAHAKHAAAKPGKSAKKNGKHR